MKKIVLVLLILAVAGGSAFAFDINSFPDPIEEGQFLISPTFHLGSFFGYGVTLGITGAVDYALPIPVALMVGGEVGVAFIAASYTPILIPILARVSWHPNFEVDNLDVYVRTKLGYAIGFGSSGYGSDSNWGGGFSWGVSSGVRYFFTEMMGVFGELGWDGYGVSYGYDYGGYYGSYGRYRYNSWIWTYFHTGVTFKVGG